MAKLSRYVTITVRRWRGKRGGIRAGMFVPRGSPMGRPPRPDEIVTYKVLRSRLKRIRHPTTRKYVSKRNRARYEKKTFDFRDAIAILESYGEATPQHAAAQRLRAIFAKKPPQRGTRFAKVTTTMKRLL